MEPDARRDPAARQRRGIVVPLAPDQLDKRFSGGLSAGVHYTWSRFEDTASEIFNPSVGEVAVAQDSFNLAADKGRSTTTGRIG